MVNSKFKTKALSLMLSGLMAVNVLSPAGITALAGEITANCEACGREHDDMEIKSDNAGHHGLYCNVVGGWATATQDDCDTNGDDGACSVCGYKAAVTPPQTVEYNVTVDLQGHGGVVIGIPSKVEAGSKITKPADPEELGYDFGGWFKEPACVTPWDFDNDTVDKDVTLYADWTPTVYTISYNLNGGTLEGTNVDKYNIESPDIVLVNPTKDGYIFAGWTGSGLTSATTTVKIGTGSTGNRLYTATWTVAHTHALGTKHAAVPANCKEAGTIEYFDCAGCEAKLDKDGNELASIVEAINPKVHKNKETKWVQTETKHKEVWECCDTVKTAEAEHKYGTEGTARYICTVCKYEDTKKRAEAADKDAEAAAKVAVDKINAIGKVELKDASKEKIEAARKAYDALTTEQKAKVTSAQLKVLTDAEAEYKKLAEQADKDAASAVVEKIKAIGTVERTEACKAKIDAARVAYNKLTDAQKKLITSDQYKILTDAENAYDKAGTTYDTVSTTTGTVKDITGTSQAASETNPFKATIKNAESLEKIANVTSSEKASGVNVWLEVKEITSTISEADKKLVADKKGDYTVGIYLDASLFKKVGTDSAKAVHDLGDKLKLSIEIPSNLRKEGRKFAVVRVHNGAATLIEGTFDSSNNTFTFETDKFSTYAVVYTDGKSATTNEPSIQTGDSSMAALWITASLVSLAGVATLAVLKRRNKNFKG